MQAYLWFVIWSLRCHFFLIFQQDGKNMEYFTRLVLMTLDVSNFDQLYSERVFKVRFHKFVRWSVDDKLLIFFVADFCPPLTVLRTCFLSYTACTCTGSFCFLLFFVLCTLVFYHGPLYCELECNLPSTTNEELICFENDMSFQRGKTLRITVQILDFIRDTVMRKSWEAMLLNRAKLQIRMKRKQNVRMDDSVKFSI